MGLAGSLRYAIAPGVFRTALNQNYSTKLTGPGVSAAHADERFGKVEELAGAAVFSGF